MNYSQDANHRRRNTKRRKRRKKKATIGIIILRIITTSISIIIFYFTFAVGNNNYNVYYNVLIIEIVASCFDISWFYTFTKKYFSLLVIFIIFSIYLLSTLLPFKFFIFKDPLTNKYGINGHK